MNTNSIQFMIRVRVSLILTSIIVVSMLGLSACQPISRQPIASEPGVDQPLSSTGDAHMQVELDIFSGRPNPQWSLSNEESVTFSRLLEALPASNIPVASPPGLGYRGFIITSQDNSLTGCEVVVIYRIDVTTTCNNQLRLLVDQNRSLEQWLLETAKGHLEARLYQQVLTLVANSP